MKVLKSHIPLTALVLSFAFTNTVLAAESATNESKDNGAANTISNADLTNNAGSDTATPVAQANTAVSDQPASQAQTIDDAQSYRKQMDERRQQAQEAQQEAYDRFLEQRKQNVAAFNSNIPADAQERHNEFLKQMEQRRALNSNESKGNEAANTISNAGSDTTSPAAQNADSETASSVAQADTAVSDQPASQAQTIDDAQSYRKQMDERRQQAQEAQQEAYDRFLEQRKQNVAAFNSNIPADAQERHNEFLKQMEQRRALNSNESKGNEAANTISNAGSDTTSPAAQNADSETASSVAQADTAVSGQQVSQSQTIDDTQSYRKQMDERRQQAQQAQLEAYKNFLERRKQYTAEFNNDIPADVQERRNEFMKQMEERRALNVKMMEEHRKAAEERRAEMQLKMHRTSTTPESAGKA